MKLVYSTKILILILVILIPGILGLGIRKIPSGFQTSLSDTENVYSGISVVQTFRADQNNLSAVALTIQNPFLRNKNDLILNVKTDNGQNRSTTINGANIADGNYQYFSFEPIADSKGQNITLTFQSPQTNPQQSLGLYHTEDNSFGSFSVNGVTKSGRLAFVSYYSPKNIFETWGMLYGNWLDKLFLDLPFAIFYSFIIVLAVGFLGLTFYKKTT